MIQATRRTIPFDSSCYELATDFLEGALDTEANRIRLAQYIQISIESELAEIEREGGAQ